MVSIRVNPPGCQDLRPFYFLALTPYIEKKGKAHLMPAAPNSDDDDETTTTTKEKKKKPLKKVYTRRRKKCTDINM